MPRTRAGATRLAAVACAATATPALAQEIKTDISPAVNVLYDSNVLRSNKVRGGARGGDVRVTPAVDFDIRRDIGRQFFTLGGTAGYDFHTRYKSLNRQRVLIDAGAHFAAGGYCKANLHAIVDYAQTDLAEVEVRIGNTTRRRVYSANLSCPRPGRLSPRFDGSRTIVSNSARIRSVFNLRAFDVSPALVYTFAGIGSIDLVGRYVEIEHPNRQFGPDSGSDRTRVTHAGVRFERKVAARLGGSIGVSYVHSQTRRDLVRSYSGPAWLAEIYYTPSPGLSATLLAQRDIKGESSIGAAYFISTLESLTVAKQIGAFTVLTGGVQRETRIFRGESNFFGLPPRGSDTSTALDAGVRYALTSKITLSASAAHRWRNSRTSFYDFAATTAGAKASIRF